jgi:ATP-dependent DNA helicase PIF1
MTFKVNEKQFDEIEEIEINNDFKKGLEAVNNSKKHIFLTGKAGSGKSTFLKYIKKHCSKNSVVLSPTGLSAININGQTIHSFFLFPPNITIEKAQLEGLKRRNHKIFKNLNLLIIDEISMVRADLLDAIDEHLKAVKGNSKSFGGVQLVFIGDLYQLPPILKYYEVETFENKYQTPYFFSSFVFQRILENAQKELIFIKLNKIYRQSDNQFIDILNQIRNGNFLLNNEAINVLNQNFNPDWAEFNNTHIILTTNNAKAESINSYNLNMIESQEYVFEGKIDGKFDPRNLPNQEYLTIKTGARVMIIKNDPKKKWQNGSLGTITLINKDSVEVMLDNGSEVLVKKEVWQNTKSVYNENENKIEQEIIGSFTQIPIKLAWAITIHKSQGQSFDKAILDLDNGSFSTGQTYVALSRVRSLDGLILARPINKSDIKVDKIITQFLDYLKSIFPKNELEF